MLNPSSATWTVEDGGVGRTKLDVVRLRAIVVAAPMGKAVWWTTVALEDRTSTLVARVTTVSGEVTAIITEKARGGMIALVLHMGFKVAQALGKQLTYLPFLLWIPL
jgi:hypothetical protein